MNIAYALCYNFYFILGISIGILKITEYSMSGQLYSKTEPLNTKQTEINNSELFNVLVNELIKILWASIAKSLLVFL